MGHCHPPNHVLLCCTHSLCYLQMCLWEMQMWIILTFLHTDSPALNQALGIEPKLFCDLSTLCLNSIYLLPSPTCTLSSSDGTADFSHSLSICTKSLFSLCLMSFIIWSESRASVLGSAAACLPLQPSPWAQGTEWTTLLSWSYILSFLVS